MCFFNGFVRLYLTVPVFPYVYHLGFGPPNLPDFLLLLSKVFQDHYKYLVLHFFFLSVICSGIDNHFLCRGSIIICNYCANIDTIINVGLNVCRGMYEDKEDKLFCVHYIRVGGGVKLNNYLHFFSDTSMWLNSDYFNFFILSSSLHYCKELLYTTLRNWSASLE